MSTQASAMQVAQYIQQKGVYGDTQLQKLLYYAQGWTLAWFGKMLFQDEIEAWQGGPVVPEVWAAGKSGNLARTTAGELPPAQKAVVDAVYDCYGNHGGRALSERTHQEQPWKDARGDLGPGQRSSQPISRRTMRRFFTEVALSGEGLIPTAPVIKSDADGDKVRNVTTEQLARWSDALAALAKQ
ncbi:Panacea domain-containing protein [Cnuibacter sp. UC19_7]|uniref:Panacea domain-containing protein n=1 Tax=Cnuibacter sp. UC19_7 TaxID=3350166 RepID=UPI00366D7782